MELYLVRHSSVDVEKGTCYGQSDVALADTFTQEIALIETLLPETFDDVYSSPLSRCNVLAKALHNADIIEDRRLMEMHFGDWENKKWDDIHSDELSKWMDNFVHQRTPNGENLIDLADRVKSFMVYLRSSNAQKVLVVTHAGVIRCFIALLLKVPYENIFKISIEYGQVVKIKLGSTETEDLLLKF